MTTTIKVDGKLSSEFEVKVGVHQGSVLSPLLFIIILEAISRYCRNGLPWELGNADHLVIVSESEKRMIEKVSKWKEDLEKKGLKVNVG